MGLNPIGNPNWPKETADLLERVTTQVREKTTDKAVVALRAVVYGLLIGIGSVIALILTLIVLTRALQALIAWPTDHPTSVWITYFAVGGLFSLLGMFLMAKRHSSSGT